ncbi:tail fiber assembly protein [Yersinia sp. Marseille-Q3913]|nr:tail fiber assembly protein [Yersinia sp. Marseille-Q3913]MBS0055526.1 tail fiber assembly protein [Yersinia sp. Marseille-Q3913]
MGNKFIPLALFSPSVLTFYPQNMIDDGSFGDNLPKDLIEITENEQTKYWKQPPPSGAVLGESDGRPLWVDAPPPTAEQLAETKAINVAQAKADKSKLISDASDKIEILKDRIEAGQDKAAELKLWKAYRIALDDVDVSAAPDIEWPTAPE